MPHARARTRRQQHRAHGDAAVQAPTAFENATHDQPPQQDDLADAATVASAACGSAVRAGTALISDAVAVVAAAAFLAPPQQLLDATGARAWTLAGSLGSAAAVVEQQEDDPAAETAPDDCVADDTDDAIDAVTAA